MRTFVRLALVAVLAGLLAGCRQSQLTSSSTPTPLSPKDVVEIALDTSTPFTVGQTTLTVMLSDGENQPIAGAKVEVRGDMNHAGMVPAQGNSISGGKGKYSVPFNWTMSGEWLVTIKATLPTGRVVSDTFVVQVGLGGS
jgi:hypothetical protein